MNLVELDRALRQLRLSGMAAHKSPEALALMRRIKQALDPAQIFNPGKTIPSERQHD